MFEESVKKFISEFLLEGKRILLEDVSVIIPDITGYSAIIMGAFIILSPMIGRSILRPLGIFAAIGIIGVSILGAL